MRQELHKSQKRKEYQSHYLDHVSVNKFQKKCYTTDLREKDLQRDGNINSYKLGLKHTNSLYKCGA